MLKMTLDSVYFVNEVNLLWNGGKIVDVSAAFKIRTDAYWNLQSFAAWNCRQNFDDSLKQLDESWRQQGNIKALKFP